MIIFQSTLPRGERHLCFVKQIVHILFQSTLPRGERQTVANGCNTAMRFQSTLPRGERQFLRQMFRGHYHFNPRSHEGSDHISAPSISFHKISIHAPTRGATCSDCPMVIRQLFQSTLPRGERPLLGHSNIGITIFQSTLPRGERQIHYIV